LSAVSDGASGKISGITIANDRVTGGQLDVGARDLYEFIRAVVLRRFQLA
jgi:hypothetical protein